MSKELHFDVSTGLKRVIGRDLITRDEVALFELVKNSFDARAGLVDVYFGKDFLIILDNGQGMSYQDLVEKWLFVAYSSKAAQEDDREYEYRQQIAERRHYAGSKGIGRFSADRLGERLTLRTRPLAGPPGEVHQLTVDWGQFENQGRRQFDEIPLTYELTNGFDLPEELREPVHGTMIRIEGLRLEWNRDRILTLKSALAKLINPFGAESDGFGINVVAPAELLSDQQAQINAERRNEEVSANALVNGQVGNFIFSTLQEKTTFSEVFICDDGAVLESVLIDRGEVIYRIREPNPFPHLQASGFRCRLYYLNQAAKLTFARRMGIPSVQFGSVFVFRNGFRVYPIGEDGDDWFGLARRKQQGFARFLGTRDVIGRLDVSGTEEDFKEASSRNDGLIDSPAVRELRECFWEYCLKRLERYVVPVSWADVAEKDTEDLSRLLTDSGKVRVSQVIARLIDNENIEVLEYSKKLVAILNERSGQFEQSLTNLRLIADKTGDSELQENIQRAESRFNELKAAEAEAVRIAAAERAAKEAAQRSAEEARTEADRLAVDLTEEKRRTSFLASITSIDVDAMLNMHHQITIYAADLKQQIENCISAAQMQSMSKDDIVSRLESVAYLNQKVLSISRLAVKANFRLESDTIEADLAEYIESYIEMGAKPFLSAGMDVRVFSDNATLSKRFGPMEVSIVVDNLISNAKKAGATQIDFNLSNIDKRTLQILVQDNGNGFSKSISDLDDIFGLGFSRTSGSGLGLYHVRQSLGEIGGSIKVTESIGRGARFEIKVSV